MPWIEQSQVEELPYAATAAALNDDTETLVASECRRLCLQANAVAAWLAEQIIDVWALSESFM